MFLVCCSLNSFSQEFKGGFFAGLTSSQVDGDNYGGFDKTGFLIGAFTNRQYSEKFFLQLEILYSHRASKHNINEEKGELEYYKMHLEFVEVPLIAIYKYSDQLAFETGISGGFLTRSYEDDGFQRFISNPYYKFAVSSIVGVKYSLTENIILDLRETYSLRPIRGYAVNKLGINKYGQFSNSLSFTINYLFN